MVQTQDRPLTDTNLFISNQAIGKRLISCFICDNCVTFLLKSLKLNKRKLSATDLNFELRFFFVDLVISFLWED